MNPYQRTAVIDYRLDAPLVVPDIVRVFDSYGIVRPTGEPARIGRMFAAADIVVSAWSGDTLVGLCPALTDFSYCCYLSDLAVDKSYQGGGIGTGLVDRLRAALCDEVSIVLLSAPTASFDTNPYFSRVFGVLPISTVNELLATLPGLFLVLGIFGTFLGIAAGLPELGNMDLSNIENTKKVMDGFLVHISAAMFKSIVGIALSAAMGVLNTLLAVETTYYTAVTRLSDSLSLAWQETDINERVAPSSSHSIPTQASGKPEKVSA